VEVDKSNLPLSADAFVAKDTFKAISKHVLYIIDLLQNNRTDEISSEIIGTENLHFREITKELLFSLRHLQVLLSVICEGVIEISTTGRIVYLNPSAKRILDIQNYELLSTPLIDIFTGKEKEQVESAIAGARESIQSLGEKEPILIRGKSIQMDFVPVVEGKERSILVILKDISVFKKVETQLTRSLREKDSLMREIHHRVKNNLNIVSSLISLQKNSIEDTKTRACLNDISNRIHSISMIHEKLYGSADLMEIPFRDYLIDLTRLIIDSLYGQTRKIRFQIKIPEINLNINQYIYLGLITTEIVTNGIKYGFLPWIEKGSPPGWEPELNISLTEDEEEYRLSICNNGMPFPGGLDIYKSHTLGLQLVQTFSSQLGGRMELNKQENTEFIIRFPKLDNTE
jgi:two-component sensor histidine kinase